MGVEEEEEEEQRILLLRNAIKEGMDSGIATSFDAEEHLQLLKKARENDLASRMGD